MHCICTPIIYVCLYMYAKAKGPFPTITRNISGVRCSCLSVARELRVQNQMLTGAIPLAFQNATEKYERHVKKLSELILYVM